MKQETKSNIVKSFLNNAKQICSGLPNQALHRTLKSLPQYKNIKICKFDEFDKEKSTTIMESNEYYEKLKSILNDKSKFEEVNVNKKTHPIIAKEHPIAYYIQKYFKGYDEKLIRKTVPSGSAPVKIYG